MPFPASPSNNDVHKVGNRAFVYDSTLGVWDQVRETDRTENNLLSGEIGGAVTGTIGDNVTFPSGHIVQTKNTVFNVQGGSYIATSSTAWVGTSSDLNITMALKNTSNHILFTIHSTQIYQTTGVNYGYLSIGKTSDLAGDDANIIRFGSDATGGRQFSVKAHNTELTGITYIAKYYPATTAAIEYQPIQKMSSAVQGFWTNNSNTNFMIFIAQEVQI